MTPLQVSKGKAAFGERKDFRAIFEKLLPTVLIYSAVSIGVYFGIKLNWWLGLLLLSFFALTVFVRLLRLLFILAIASGASFSLVGLIRKGMSVEHFDKVSTLGKSLFVTTTVYVLVEAYLFLITFLLGYFLFY